MTEAEQDAKIAKLEQEQREISGVLLTLRQAFLIMIAEIERQQRLPRSRAPNHKQNKAAGNG